MKQNSHVLIEFFCRQGNDQDISPFNAKITDSSTFFEEKWFSCLDRFTLLLYSLHLSFIHLLIQHSIIHQMHMEQLTCY